MESGQEGDWLAWPCWLKGLIPMPMSAEPPKPQQDNNNMFIHIKSVWAVIG